MRGNVVAASRTTRTLTNSTLCSVQNEILDVMAPYIAPVIGEFTDWTPLEGRETLFKEDVDREDPWQFKNILVE